MKQAELWYFGEKAGVDFRTGTAFAVTDQNVMNALKATSVICDSLGNLLFFTDGRRVWDRTFNLMPNATGLEGDLGSTQPCIIVPLPGDSSIFYIFTTDIIIFRDLVNYTTQGLTYTMIDLKLRNGLGDASPVYLNVPLLTPVCQKLTGVAHANGKDFWVITHEWNSDKFYSYRISNAGIASPVISAAGTLNGGDSKSANNAVGYLKASPDGRRLASVISHSKIVEVFDFDNVTGEITNPQTYTAAIQGVNPYGVEFSPDSRFLYATVLETGGVETPSRPSFLLQFDLAAGLSAPVIIDSLPGIRMAAIQLGPDGRIYLSRTKNHQSKKDSLEVIYNPTRPGRECNFNLLNNLPGSGFPLSGRKSVYSLPNLVQSYVHVPAFRWDSVCQGDVTRFRITNSANIDSVLWDFGDGTTSTSFQPLHRYAAPGSFKVRLTERFNGKSYTDSLLVTNYPLPVIALPDTVMLYTGSSVNLHAGGGYEHYLWSTGSGDSVVVASHSGNYSVHVIDSHCCANDDTTYVKVFEFFVPNAFSPNGDGLNDVFRVFAQYTNVAFRMVVYDRWGQEVFSSDDISKGWDGRVNGRECPPESYVWVVNISFLGQDIITTGDIVKKGTVTIIR